MNHFLQWPLETIFSKLGREIPTGLPSLEFHMPWQSLPDLLIPGCVIAVVGFAEPAAIARTLATRGRQPWNPDREFISQGMANIASALCGAFPVGGSFSRSSVAKLAGARSRFTGLIAGIIVFAALPFASLLNGLPTAVLGAIVIAATVRLIRIPALVRLIRVTWGQSLVAWGTFLATLFFAPRVDLGLIFGIALATGVHLRREAKIQLSSEVTGHTLVLAPSGVLYFGSAPGLSQELVNLLASHQHIEQVVVDLGRLGRVDYTGAVELKAFCDDCTAAGLTVGLRTIPPHARGTLTRYLGADLLERLSHDAE